MAPAAAAAAAAALAAAAAPRWRAAAMHSGSSTLTTRRVISTRTIASTPGAPAAATRYVSPLQLTLGDDDASTTSTASRPRPRVDWTGFRLPTPAAAWRFDEGRGAIASSVDGGGNARLAGDDCRWTNFSRTNRSWTAAELPGACWARVSHRASLNAGMGSLSACARFRTTMRGGTLLSKLGASADGQLSGWCVELGEEGGLGVSLADGSGVSANREIGRTLLADDRWHHACVVFQRRAPSQLVLYVDGALSERAFLESTPLARLGSLDSVAPLLIGRRGDGSPLRGAIRDVGVWARPLLPEHVKQLAASGFPLRGERRAHHGAPKRRRPPVPVDARANALGPAIMVGGMCLAIALFFCVPSRKDDDRERRRRRRRRDDESDDDDDDL